MDETEDATRGEDASATPDAAPIGHHDHDRTAAPTDTPASGASQPLNVSPQLPVSNSPIPPTSTTSHRVLPKGCSFKKKPVQTGPEPAHMAGSAEDRDEPMQQDPEFDPNSIIDYDETERTTRKQQQPKKKGRASKTGQ